MFIRKYWIPLLVFIMVIVGVGLYYLQTRPPKDPILIVNPVEFEKSPAKAPIVEQPEQVGHVHEDGTFHADTPAPVATSTRTGPLTYHADLLASNPVEALRAQAKERGHWSAVWIPPFPPDDHEAQTYARYYYLRTYYESTGETDTPAYKQMGENIMSYLDAVRALPYSTRHSDLLKISWSRLPAGSVVVGYHDSDYPLPLE